MLGLHQLDQNAVRGRWMDEGYKTAFGPDARGLID